MKSSEIPDDFKVQYKLINWFKFDYKQSEI